MSQLLCIPFKKTIHADLKEKLAKLINANFYQTSSIFEDDLIKLSKLREIAVKVNVSETDLKKLKEYYIQFCQLKIKFPDDQLEVTWFETLGLKSYGRKGSSFQFEELNLVYNIGAMYSMLAVDNNNGSPEGQKKTCQYFQLSAGCFDYISSHVHESNDISMDENAISSLKYLMLAQAQETVWWKAIGDNLKPALTARLAYQVSLFYELAWKEAKMSELIKSDWQKRFQEKSLYFVAVARYRQSLDFEERKEYGAKVAALKSASTHLNEIKLEDESVIAFMSKIRESSKIAERDNDLIYLQPVPPVLPTLKPAPMVKCIYFEGLKQPFDDKILESIGGPLFKSLLPISVMEASTAFNERQDEYVQQHVVAPIKALTNLLKEHIPTFELPEALKPMSENDLQAYELSMVELQLNNKNISDVLHQIRLILEQEASTDSSLRSRHGSLRWTLKDSQTANSEYIQRYEKISSYLNQGRKVDDDTFQLFLTVDKALLTNPVKLPESTDPLVKEASDVIKQRDAYIIEVEAKSGSNSLLPKIISLYKKTRATEFEDLFAEHLVIFRDDLTFVQQEKKRNEVLIRKLVEHTERDTTKRLDARDLYVQDFKYSLKILEDVKENIKSGSTFYQDLMKSATALLNDVQKFEASRKEEKKGLEMLLMSNATDS